MVAPCGFVWTRTLAEMPALDGPARVARAVRGPRRGAPSPPTATSISTARARMLFDTPQILAEMLHPDQFPPEHEGTIWRRLPTPG